MSEAKAKSFTLLRPEHWRALPLKLRQRWWAETDYGRLEPSAELRAEIAQHEEGREQ